MSEKLDGLKNKFLEAQKQLEVLLLSADSVSEDTLQKLDKNLSEAFSKLMQVEFERPEDYLERAKVLSSQVRKLNCEMPLIDNLAEQIEKDVNRYQQLRSQPDIRLIENGAQQYSLPDQIVELCYSSFAVSHLGEDELQALQSQADKHNSEWAITGLLTYDESTKRFFQILEGPENDVRRLMNRIINDSRHTDIKVLFVTRITKRVFSQWSMQLLNANRIKSELQSGETVEDWFERFSGIQSDTPKTPGHQWMIESIGKTLE